MASGQKTGKYDWLQTYDAAKVGTYGDTSGDVIDRIKSVAGSDFADAQKAGIIKADGTVDWSKAPALAGYNAAGGDAPKGSSLQPTGGRAGLVDPWSKAPVTKGQGGTGVYQDENYGGQTLTQNRAPDDWQMKLGRALAIGAFAGPTAGVLAPMVGSGLGLSSGWNATIAGLLKSAPGLVMSGGNGALSLLGGVVGGASGVPFGSAIGGAVGSYAQMSPQQRDQLNQMIGGH